MFDLIYGPGARTVLLRRRVADDLDSLPLAPDAALPPAAFLFESSGLTFRVRSAGDDAPLRDCYSISVREAFSRLPEHLYRAVVKGSELLQLDAAHRFCGFCGAPAVRRGPLMRVCSRCGKELFPQVSPCVIVLVKRGDDEALLVHARNFRTRSFGLVAGYVETGETLEECVAREIQEETSLRVRNIRYIGSQPWPNPGNLMVCFTAEYAGGELRFADGELSEGGFFSRHNLPSLPTGSSIARKMVNLWLERKI